MKVLLEHETRESNDNSHYSKLGLQPIHAIRAWKASWGKHAFELGSIVKYAARLFEKDDPLKNLAKIEYYCAELRLALEEDADRAEIREKERRVPP